MLQLCPTTPQALTYIFSPQHPSVRYEPCLPHRGGGRGFVASADVAPGTLLLVEKRFLPMPTAVECGLAAGVGQVCTMLVLGCKSISLC